jgi:hypothetical protein
LPGITSRHAAAAMTDSHLVTRIRRILNLEDKTMIVSRKALMAAAGMLFVAGGFAASFAEQQSPIKAPGVPGEPQVGQPANAASSAVELSNDSKVLDAELAQAIKTATVYLQESGGAAVELLALDEAAIDPHTVLLDATSATARGLGSLLLQQSAGPRKWGPEQATGAPNSPDYPNNQGTAWCPATADGQEEWLELTYAEPVEPLALVVYECQKPGALTRVVAFDAEGNELNAWSGKDPSPPDSGTGSAISVVPLKLKKIKIVRVHLFLDSQHVEGWNEIDAVGILDVKGAVHWATSATASSTFVDQTAAIGLNLVKSQPLDFRLNINEGQEVTAAQVLLKIATEGDSLASGLLISPQLTGNPDRVSQFEERIKKLEAELAGLREALQQLKSAPAGETEKVP